MWLDTILLLVSLALAALLGFAAHRASICTVRAVEEVLTSRRPFILISFAKTVLWIVAVTSLLLWVLPETGANVVHRPISLPGVAGGLIFGIGAVVNAGCAFSTLTRLGDGQLSMLLSLVGFILGVAGHSFSVFEVPTSASFDHSVAHSEMLTVPWMLGAALLFWAAWETLRLWRTRPAAVTIKALLLTKRYRLSTAALLLGLSNAVLYALHGNWMYTSTLSRGIERALGSGAGPGALLWLLFLAVMVGMALSSWHRGSFRLQWRPDWSWASRVIGGSLMGFGAALVPGGNDVLLLHGIPSLSPHAVPAYVAMLFGVAAALVLMRALGFDLERVDCAGDVCRR